MGMMGKAYGVKRPFQRMEDGMCYLLVEIVDEGEGGEERLLGFIEEIGSLIEVSIGCLSSDGFRVQSKWFVFV